MTSQPRFVVTAWRDSEELLQLRHDLYSVEIGRRQKAVSKVFAWRLRKPDGLPLLLESTADIVDVVVQDERAGLKHNALRLLYATAVSRFVTGLADTQIELTRDRPSWFPPGKCLQLPLALLEVRHRIVHRHLPSLAELKRAATQSLAWLWEWYWSQLDHAFLPPTTTTTTSSSITIPTPPDSETTEPTIQHRLHALLKTYIKERKTALKTRKSGLNAAPNALTAYTHILRSSTLPSSSSSSSPHTRTRDTLLELLIDTPDPMLLPAAKQPGSAMAGAFLIWTPFLVAFCTAAPTPVVTLDTLLARLVRGMNGSVDGARSEGLHDWVVYILGSGPCAELRAQGKGKGKGDGRKDGEEEQEATKRVVERVLAGCLAEPTGWNVRVAGSVVRGVEWRGKENWRAVLEAVEGEAGTGMVEVEVEVEHGGDGDDVMAVLDDNHFVVAEGTKEKSIGPQKVLGMWKPRPIGWLPVDFEEDE